MSSWTKSEARLVRMAALLEFAILWDFMSVMPLGALLTREIGIGPTEFSWVVSSYTWASGVFGFLSGLLLNLRQPRRFVAPLTLALALSTLLGAYSESLSALISSRILAGAAGGLLWSSAVAVVTSEVAPERRGRAMATILSAYSVSAVLGIPISLFVAERFGYRSAFGVVGAFALLLALPAFFVFGRGGERSGEAETKSLGLRANLSALKANRLPERFALSASVVFASYCFIPQLSTYFVRNLGLSASHLAYAYLVGGISTFFSLRLLGNLTDRFGASRVFPITVLCAMVAFAALPWVGEVGTVGLVLLFSTCMICFSSRMVPTIELVSGDLAPAERGRFFAINTAATDFSAALSTSLVGSLFSEGPGGVLLGFPAASAVALAVSLFGLGIVFLRFSESSEIAEAVKESPV